METKKCKYCYLMIPKSAKDCPNCKRRSKSHNVLILGLIIFAFLVYIFISAITPVFVSSDEYNQIEQGMFYEQVVDIIGSFGILDSETEGYGVRYEIYSWHTLFGGHVLIMFKTEKLQQSHNPVSFDKERRIYYV